MHYRGLKCLTGYALHPSYSDPAYDVAIYLARDQLSRIDSIIDGEIKISKRFNLPYNIDKSSDVARREELRALISKLEVVAKERKRIKALEKINQPLKTKQPQTKYNLSLDGESST